MRLIRGRGQQKAVPRPVRAVGLYVFNLLHALDITVNAVFFGGRRQTISARIGGIKARYRGRIPWRRPVAKALDALLELVDEGHSLEALEGHLHNGCKEPGNGEDDAA